MKKGLLVALVMVLLCLAASGLAAVKLPTHLDEVTSQLPEKPKAPAFELEITADGAKVSITDGSKPKSIIYGYNVDDNEWLAVDMIANEEGNVFTIVFEEGKTAEDTDSVNIYYDADGKTEIICFDITDTKNPGAFSSHVLMGDDESLNVHWNADGELNYASVTGSYSEDFDCYITFDDEGDVIQYNLFNETSDIYFNADGSVKRAEMYGDDADVYSYVDGKWYLNGEEEIVQVPEWAVSIVNEKQDEIKKILNQLMQPEKEVKWYAQNSVCVAGLSLRDDLHMSDKWYNVAPIDLTQEGTQTLYLVAGNRHHIGKAYVTVADGNVTVDYKLHGGHGYIKDECVKWFTSLDEITAEFIENPTSDLTFGQAVSIAEDLGGADTAILFIRNVATYRQPYTNAGGELSRYWRNRDRWIESREDMMTLLGIEAK